MITLNNKAVEFVNKCESECSSRFKHIEEIEFSNQLKVLNAFNKK